MTRKKCRLHCSYKQLRHSGLLLAGNIGTFPKSQTPARSQPWAFLSSVSSLRTVVLTLHIPCSWRLTFFNSLREQVQGFLLLTCPLIINTELLPYGFSKSNKRGSFCYVWSMGFEGSIYEHLVPPTHAFLRDREVVPCVGPAGEAGVVSGEHNDYLSASFWLLAPDFVCFFPSALTA